MRFFPGHGAPQRLAPTLPSMSGEIGLHAGLESAVNLPGAVDFFTVLPKTAG
jgi:hypothetical protein